MSEKEDIYFHISLQHSSHASINNDALQSQEAIPKPRF